MGFGLSKFYEVPPLQNNKPSVSPTQIKVCGPSPWEQEHTQPGALNVRSQEVGEEESLAGAGRKIEPLKIAKQKMPREILHCHSCLPEKSLLIWG